ncbi:MAG TPA: DUF4334 domain-containing protein [Labilithrix sp.]|nr:DUF4334 domain-containing protein [Labilithrix sp.]
MGQLASGRKPADRLTVLERGCTADEALAFFDSLPTLRSEELIGRWKGAELPTGHPLAGLLDRFGWYGKEFVDAERVHPLLFRDRSGGLFTVDPRKLPLSLAPQLKGVSASLARQAFAMLEPLLATREPRARLRNAEYRGKVSATMIYDHLPICDVFRRIDADTVLGAMDRRGDHSPFVFILRRERAS